MGQLIKRWFGLEFRLTPVQELIEEKYLAPFKIYSPSKIIDAANAKIRTTAGDYNQKQLAELVEKTLIIGDAVETWITHAYLKRTVLFAVSVKHSKELAQGFRDAGIPALKRYHYKMSRRCQSKFKN